MKFSLRIVCALGLATACWTLGFSQTQNAPVKNAKPGHPAMSLPLKASAPPKSPAVGTEETTLATVNGQPIYRSDLAGSSAAQLFQIRQQEYKDELQALNAAIGKKLVEFEAQKEGLTVEQLFQREVDSKVPAPSEAEAKGYYLAIKSQTQIPFVVLEPKIMEVLRKADIQEARNKYADSLRTGADISILLRPPSVETGENDPQRIEGNPNAPITIVEFGDYECPFCGRAEPTLMDLLKKYDGKVKLAFRDFPLSSIHPLAEEAAEASRCAEAQGKFWPMHNAMYADQSKLSEGDLIQTAAGLGLNKNAFTTCLKSGEFKAAIQRDVEAGQRAGVTGTPSFFINGRFVDGAVPEQQFEDVIDSELSMLKQNSPQSANR